MFLSFRHDLHAQHALRTGWLSLLYNGICEHHCVSYVNLGEDLEVVVRYWGWYDMAS